MSINILNTIKQNLNFEQFQIFLMYAFNLTANDVFYM